MIPKKIDEITELDIFNLINGRVEESVTLDFKRELPPQGRDATKEFVSDVCALANTKGGDLIYGVEEGESGEARKVSALQLQPDEEVLRLTNMVTDGLEPKLHGITIRPIKVSGGFILIARVPKSLYGIHRNKIDGHFYIRETRSKRQLDVPGIKQKIEGILGTEDRTKSFFAHRYATIISNNASLPLPPGPKLVVHLVPMTDFLEEDEIDVSSATRGQPIQLLSGHTSSNAYHTYEGQAFIEANNKMADTYTLVMHNGVIEACIVLSLQATQPNSPEKLNLSQIEYLVMSFLGNISSELVGAVTNWPLIVRVALIGADGVPAGSGLHDDYRFHRQITVRQPLSALVLPDAMFISPDSPLDTTMHKTFLRLWNAWGYPRRVSKDK